MPDLQLSTTETGRNPMSGGYLSGIFGASPVRPLQEHMLQVLECVRELIPFTKAVIAGDETSRDEHHIRIVDLEHKADILKKDLRLHLPTSLFMPVDRRDVLEVLTMQDKVAGRVRDVAGILVGRRMQLPASMANGFLELVETCYASCEKAHQAICELDELIETGFDKGERERVGEVLAELDAIEHETDEQAIRLCNTLFELEDELPPVQAMFLYRVLDKTGGIADNAQRVGSRLQLMLAR